MLMPPPDPSGREDSKVNRRWFEGGPLGQESAGGGYREEQADGEGRVKTTSNIFSVSSSRQAGR